MKSFVARARLAAVMSVEDKCKQSEGADYSFQHFLNRQGYRQENVRYGTRAFPTSLASRGSKLVKAIFKA